MSDIMMRDNQNGKEELIVKMTKRAPRLWSKKITTDLGAEAITVASHWEPINAQLQLNGAMSTVRKQDAHRALELLEEYHSQLSKPQDRALRNAIERVIRIFKSRLFQALLDIQEFYEVTLLDESKTLQQKTIETLQVRSCVDFSVRFRQVWVLTSRPRPHYG